MSARSNWDPKITRRAVLGGAVTLTLGASLPTFGRPTAVRTWRHYTNCRFGQMHVRTSEPMDGSGEGKTPLICLHESPMSGREFQEFQPVIATDRRILCVDTAGYGASDGPVHQPELDEYGAALADALTSLGYGADGAGSVDLLGYHTGTVIACSLANQRPDLVRRLVLPSTPYFPPKMREEQRRKYGKPRPFDDPDYVGSNYREIVLGKYLGPQRDSPLSIPRRHQRFATRLRPGTRSEFGFEAVFRYDLDHALSAINQPAFLPVLSEWLDGPTRQAAALIPNSTLVERPDFTKYVWDLKPAQMADLVRPFLDRDQPPRSTSISEADRVARANIRDGGDLNEGGIRYSRAYVGNRYGQMHVSSARPATSNKPPVVLFHQSPVSGRIFNELAQSLSIDRTVYAPDTPGFGDSDGPSTKAEIADLAGAMTESLIKMGCGPNGSRAARLVRG